MPLYAASSEFYDKAGGNYVFKKSDKSKHSSAQMAAYWTKWAEKYPIVSIEDDMAEDDWAGWKTPTQSIGGRASAGPTPASSSQQTCPVGGYPHSHPLPTPKNTPPTH